MPESTVSARSLLRLAAVSASAAIVAPFLWGAVPAMAEDSARSHQIADTIADVAVPAETDPVATGVVELPQAEDDPLLGQPSDTDQASGTESLGGAAAQQVEEPAAREAEAVAVDGERGQGKPGYPEPEYPEPEYPEPEYPEPEYPEPEYPEPEYPEPEYPEPEHPEPEHPEPEHPEPEYPEQPVLAQTGASAAIPAVGGLITAMTGALAMILGRRRPVEEERD